MLPLTKEGFKQLRQVLISVYPSTGDLEIFVAEELGENLAVITNEGNLKKDTFRLLQWAKAAGREEELFQAFCNCNKENPAVIELQHQLSKSKSDEAQSDESQSSKLQSTAASRSTKNLSTQPRAQLLSANESASSQQSSTQPIEIFISYSHKDEGLKDDLCEHLANLTRQGKVSLWQDRAIEAGTEWDAQIKAKLESASIILLLITPPFVNSEYCFDKEMQRAMERHEEGSARVIPVIMRPCDWKDTPFSKLQALPKNSKPVTLWDNRDEAMVDVVKGIRLAVESLTGTVR